MRISSDDVFGDRLFQGGHFHSQTWLSLKPPATKTELVV